MILNKPVLNSGVGGLEEIFKNTPYICKSRNEYLRKIMRILARDIILNPSVESTIVNQYTDKEYWKQNVENSYERS